MDKWFDTFTAVHWNIKDESEKKVNGGIEEAMGTSMFHLNILKCILL